MFNLKIKYFENFQFFGVCKKLSIKIERSLVECLSEIIKSEIDKVEKLNNGCHFWFENDFKKNVL